MHRVVQPQREFAGSIQPVSGDVNAECARIGERKIERMALVGRKKFYRRGFVLPDLTGKNFGADAGQGHAKDGLLMRVNGNLRFYGIDAVNQSQSGDLVRFDDATVKRTFLN